MPEEEHGSMKRYVINPPPADKRCECCGRRISELGSFGGAGDPVVGDFTGALLVKRWRLGFPPMSPHEREELKKKSGEEADVWLQLEGSVGASWECRDCIVLSDQEYFERRRRAGEDAKGSQER